MLTFLLEQLFNKNNSLKNHSLKILVIKLILEKPSH